MCIREDCGTDHYVSLLQQLQLFCFFFFLISSTYSEWITMNHALVNVNFATTWGQSRIKPTRLNQTDCAPLCRRVAQVRFVPKIIVWMRLSANNCNQSCNGSIRRGLVNTEEKSISRRREKSKLHAGIFISKRGDWNYLILAEMSWLHVG